MGDDNFEEFGGDAIRSLATFTLHFTKEFKHHGLLHSAEDEVFPRVMGGELFSNAVGSTFTVSRSTVSTCTVSTSTVSISIVSTSVGYVRNPVVKFLNLLARIGQSLLLSEVQTLGRG